MDFQPEGGERAMGRWWHEANSSDVEQHAAHFEGWQWRYEQLSGGAFSARLAAIELPSMSVYREQTSCATRQCGSLPTGSVGFVVPWFEDGALRLNGMCLGPGHAAVGRDPDVETCTPPDCDLAFIVADAGLIDETLERTGVGAGMLRHRSSMVKLAPAPVESLRRLLSAVHGTLGTAPDALETDASRRLLADRLMSELIDVLSACPPAEERNAVLRKRLVDRARELMLSQPEEPPTILEVCKRVGASRRKLNYCFQDVLGMSPIAYLRAIRLNAVRRGLLGAEAAIGVYDVAARFGFWHFGQFSADYKRLFGELPSSTLQRGRSGF